MLNLAIRTTIEADRAAGFPDPAGTVRRLHELIGEELNPAWSLVDNANAWWLGCVEIPFGRMCKGEVVAPEVREIALWADEWWNDFETKLYQGKA